LCPFHCCWRQIVHKKHCCATTYCIADRDMWLNDTQTHTRTHTRALLFQPQRRLRERAKMLRYTYTVTFVECELLIRNCKEFEYEYICSNLWQECSQVKSRRRSDRSSVIISTHTITQRKGLLYSHV
jgi:hypothetical protein